jgi:hypothetical protein
MMYIFVQFNLRTETLSIFFQEVYFEYNKRETVSQTLSMKVAPLLWFSLQILEFLCYATLHSYVSNHHKMMLSSDLISSDIYRSRKRIHLLSMAAQLYGFLVKVVYISFVILYRILGKRYPFLKRFVYNC